MAQEIELHEITAPSGRKYSFRRMTYSEKHRFTKVALNRLRKEMIGLDVSKEAAVFGAAIRSEMQLVIMMKTFQKADGIPEGTRLEDSNLDNLIDSKDYDALNTFLDELNYPKAEVKKNSENSSGESKKQMTQK